MCSTAFSMFDVASPLREYLYIFLRSIVGKLQLEKTRIGTEYPTISDGDIVNILVPILPKQIQKKIATLIQRSHETRRKSKELLEEAKKKVEVKIEKS